MNTKDILTEAKNLINLQGWVQGEMGTTVKGFCVWGAIDEAAGNVNEMLRAVRKVRETLKAQGSVTDVAAWNDADHRTKVEVLELLDEAAANA